MKFDNQIPVLAERDFFWVIGVLEGEGSFLAACPSESVNRVKVVVEMTDEDVIARLAGFWNRSYHSPASRNPKWKRTYVTLVTGRAAVAWMRAIRPHMGMRRQDQIDRALSKYDPMLYVSPHMRSPFMREDVMEMAQLRASGLTFREIGERYGVAGPTIFKRLKKLSASEAVSVIE